MRKLLMVDGNNLLFKMFYGMPFPFFNDNKADITGTVGVIGTVVKMIKYLDVDDCLVVFDGENSINLRADGEYKTNRQIDYGGLKDEENPFTQLAYIKAVLDYLDIKWVETEEIECDDYIAIISEKYAGNIYISSTDTDFYQLVNEKNRVINFRGKNTVLIDDKLVYEKYGVGPRDFVLYKALVGDKADNIKGVSKVGPKTAVKIIHSIRNKCNDRYLEIFKESLNHINHNMELIELPNASIDMKKYDLKDYRVNKSGLKNFKTMRVVTEVTNGI